MYLNKISVIRAIAIITVVFGHSIILYDPSWGLYTPGYHSDFLRIVKKIINLYQMPLFFSLSGFLFYFSVLKEESLHIFLKKKLKRIMFPYFIICFLWMDPIKLLLHVPGYDNIIGIITDQLLFKNNGHLWYLPTLFLIFVLYKILFKIKLRNNKYFDLVLLLISFVLNHYSYVFYMNLIFYYQYYFLLGYFIHKYNFNIKYTWMTPICIIILLIIGINTPSATVITVLSTMIIILFYHTKYYKFETSIFLQKISKNSFGIYLFHSPLIYITFTYANNLMPVYVLTINLFLWGYVAYKITDYIKQTNYKFIIGE